MIKFVDKYPSFFKYSSFAIFVTSVGWTVYQVKHTKKLLNEAIDSSILNILEPKPQDLYEESPNTHNVEVLTQQKTVREHRSLDILHSLQFLFAQKLISLSHNKNSFIRLKAINYLAKIKSLDDWHCSLLANMIDKHTAVTLARVRDVDHRLFTAPPPRYLNYDHNMIVNEMKELLLNLYEKSKHPCLEYFISRVFFDAHEVSRLVDSDTEAVELTKFLKSDQDLLPICLESILHHASFEQYAEDIVNLNGLPLLTEIYKRFKNNVNVNVTLCRIISYFSFYPKLLEELYRTGWIGILSKWIKHDDIRISIPASRALANFEAGDESYSRHVYLLHPNYLGSRNPKVDIVFVHGLLGGVFFTWRQRVKSEFSVGLIGKKGPAETITQGLSYVKTCKSKKPEEIKCSDPVTMQYIKDFEEHCEADLIKDFEVVLDDIPIAGDCTDDCGYSRTCDNVNSVEESEFFTQCWPRDWLPDDCQNLRVIGINYDTTLSMWNSICPNIYGKTNIDQQSNKLLTSMLQAGLGKRPIIWITHSMGGLLVKNILCKAHQSSDPKMKSLCGNTKGVVFYSTPHFGSSLATFNQASQLVLWPSMEVQNLRVDSPFLKDLHEKFIKMLEVVPMKVITFTETKKTVFTALKFNFQLVTPESGNPGVGEYYEIPLDHLGICKPLSRNSFLYRKVIHLIREVLQMQAEENQQKVTP